MMFQCMSCTETGTAIVQYENGDGSQQVMELFIQTDVSKLAIFQVILSSNIT